MGTVTCTPSWARPATGPVAGSIRLPTAARVWSHRLCRASSRHGDSQQAHGEHASNDRVRGVREASAGGNGSLHHGPSTRISADGLSMCGLGSVRVICFSLGVCKYQWSCIKGQLSRCYSMGAHKLDKLLCSKSARLVLEDTHTRRCGAV